MIFFQVALLLSYLQRYRQNESDCWGNSHYLSQAAGSNYGHVRVQDADSKGADDPAVLAWAAGEGRVLLTHDVNTLTAFGYERVAQELPMQGVFEVSLKSADQCSRRGYSVARRVQCRR